MLLCLAIEFRGRDTLAVLNVMAQGWATFEVDERLANDGRASGRVGTRGFQCDRGARRDLLGRRTQSRRRAFPGQGRLGAQARSESRNNADNPRLPHWFIAGEANRQIYFKILIEYGPQAEGLAAILNAVIFPLLALGTALPYFITMAQIPIALIAALANFQVGPIVFLVVVNSHAALMGAHGEMGPDAAATRKF